MAAEDCFDPNKIQVTIADQMTPIVVLFGPPSCGKTMTLIRLVRYLLDCGYSVIPDHFLRPASDTYYSLCDNFAELIHRQDPLAGKEINFILIKVLKKERTVCQILDIPGDWCFDPNNPLQQPFLTFLSPIITSPNRKIWAMFLEPDWADIVNRQNYVNCIQLLRQNMSVRDKAIFVYNKIDLTQYLIDNSGNAHVPQARKMANALFEGIFEPFKNPTPIARWFAPYKCDFTVFQTGDYMRNSNGTIMYKQGPDAHPRNLWNIIMEQIRG